MFAERGCRPVDVPQFAHGIWRSSGLVPFGAGQSEDFFHHQIAFDKVKRLRLNLGLLLLARDLFLAELDAFQDHTLVAGEVVEGHAEAVAQGNQHAGARHVFVALVLADRLGRDPVSNSGLQIPQ